MEDIHEQVYGLRKEMDTLSGVRAYRVKMYLLIESGIKKTITCINFVTV
jgi:hypothetical protein